MNNQGFGIGDRVTWGYWHSLNSRSRTWIEKSGVLLGFVSERKKSGRHVSGVYAKVHFDNNKHPSKVRADQLWKEKHED